MLARNVNNLVLRLTRACVRRLLVCAAAIVALGGAEAGSARSLAPIIPPVAPPRIGLLPVGDGLPPTLGRTELLHSPVPGWVWAPPARRLVMMQVTAYCPCPICCGPTACGLTASGNYIDYNRGQFVAADPTLPFGTKLVVPGYAATPVEVIDRGGAIRGNRLDVFFATHEQARAWGRKMLPVTIVNE